MNPDGAFKLTHSDANWVQGPTCLVAMQGRRATFFVVMKSACAVG